PTGQRQENFGVKAYRKTSEGYLFFLPNGIFYGFKRPCLLFPLNDIATTSFHDITQRTFNLTLTMKPGHNPLGVGYDVFVNKNKDPAADPVEGDSYEFSMIDQTEYGVIDQYIKKNKINDNSMSEERKAPPPKLQRDEGEDDDEEESETTKKQKHTKHDDDDDDEEDVNFQPSDNSDDDDLEYDSQASDNEEANGSDEEEEEEGEGEEEEGE
ncbi:histone chaperone Rttp106-like-domain-containing protein, partial [Umbelopsis sp. PMI_123]